MPILSETSGGTAKIDRCKGEKPEYEACASGIAGHVPEALMKDHPESKINKMIAGEVPG
ncbi:MAG: hypothetical protein V8S95_10760 [Odoribacter sp.]